MNSLWRTYLLFVIGSIAFTCVTIFTDWQSIQEESNKELSYVNTIIAHPMVALLDKNEALLEMLGRRLVEIDYSQIKSSLQIYCPSKSKLMMIFSLSDLCYRQGNLY